MELVLYIGKDSQADESRFPASITYVNKMRFEAFLLNGVRTVFAGVDYADYRSVLPPAQGASVVLLLWRITMHSGKRQAGTADYKYDR